MKIENIPADIKSKSLKQTRDEIDAILSKLENLSVNLIDSKSDYQRLILLNKHMEGLFKKMSKEISKKFNYEKKINKERKKN
tara:strand:+ start:971 stop:1216 length:246 start_codon:yes stop_codon:yes gene_type:complete